MPPSITDTKDAASVSAHLEATGQHQKLADVLPVAEKPWYKTSHLVRLNLCLLVPLVSSYVTGFDGSMLNGMQSVPAWVEDFDNPTGAQLGLINVIQLIGSIVALPFAPWLCDAVGRRHPIALGSVIIIIGAVIMGVGQGIGMFLAGRALVGVGGGFVSTASAPLLAELAYPTQRPVITAIFNTSWYLGSIVAAWVTYGTFRLPNSWSWRIPTLLQALPSLLQLAFVYFIPESPRWLISKGRSEDAERVLTRYHCAEDTPNTLVRWELAEITAAIHNEKEQDTASYMHFIKTPGNRHRLFIAVIMGFMIQWCGNGLISVYLVQVLRNIGITDPETQNLINGILQIVNYLTALGAAFFVDRFGRRFMFLLSLAGMTLAAPMSSSAVLYEEGQPLSCRTMVSPDAMHW